MENSLNSSHSKMTRSAGIVSLAVMGSRVLGLMREMVLAYLIDVKRGLDPFYAAYTIPNLFRDLFGEGALSKAFVSTFAHVAERSGEKAAWRLASLVFNALIIILTVITFIGIVLAPFMINFILRGEGFDTPLPDDESGYGLANKRELTIYLTRIMFPYLLLVSLAAVSMGLLNSKGRFGIPASASSFFNLGSVIVGVWGYYTAPQFGQHPLVGMAVGTLAGGILQFGVQIPSMWRVGFRYRPILSFSDPDLRQVMKLIAPAMLGTAAMQINVVVNRLFFASQEGGWYAWNTQAFRLMHLPMGALGVAISTATLPVLSRLVAQNSMDEYKGTISYALKLAFIFVLPASAGLIALSRPIVSLLFQRGEFSAEDTVQVSRALFFYAFGLCGYSGVKIATDGFYAIKNIRTPVIISLFTISLNMLLNYIFIFRLGIDHRSLAISTACSITVNFILVLGFLRRKVGCLGGHNLASVFVRSAIASAFMGASASISHRYMSAIAGGEPRLMVAIAILIITIVISVSVFYGICRAFRLREIDQITRAIAGKFRR